MKDLSKYRLFLNAIPDKALKIESALNLILKEISPKAVLEISSIEVKEDEILINCLTEKTRNFIEVNEREIMRDLRALLGTDFKIRPRKDG